MAREYDQLPIADLLPWEKTYTGPKLHSAERRLKANKNKLDYPVEVFQYAGHWFVLDGTHRCLAALKAGHTAVPIVQVNPPVNAAEAITDMVWHLAHQGFKDMPRSGLADRADGKVHIDVGDIAADIVKREKEKRDEQQKRDEKAR